MERQESTGITGLQNPALAGKGIFEGSSETLELGLLHLGG